jgi:hypothetical protein
MPDFNPVPSATRRLTFFDLTTALFRALIPKLLQITSDRISVSNGADLIFLSVNWLTLLDRFLNDAA